MKRVAMLALLTMGTLGGCAAPVASVAPVEPASPKAITVRVDVVDEGEPALRGTLVVAPALRDRLLVRLHTDEGEPTLR